MKKIFDLLEQKVQWIVLLLAIAWIGYTGYAFLWAPPVMVEVGGKQVGPADIDKEVLTIADELDRKVKETRIPSNMPQPQQYVSGFKATMDYGGKVPEPNANALSYHKYGHVRLPRGLDLPDQPQPTPGFATPQPVPGQPSVPTTDGIGTVDKLPTPAAPAISAMLTGLSNVNTNPAAPGAEATAPVAGVDKGWITIRFDIDLDSLARGWDESKFPDNAKLTSFLRVFLTRQELQPDGTWGKDTLIGPLAINNVPTYPAANAPAGTQFQYIQWAVAHTQEILQPPFFPVLKGDASFIPGEQPPPVSIVADFKPETYIDWTPQQIDAARFSMDQKRAIQLAKQRANDARGRGRGGPTQRPAAPRGGGGGGVDAFAPNDPDRPISYQPAVDVDVPVEHIVPGGVAGAPAPTRVAPVVGAGAGKFVFPAGEFDPRAWASQHKGQPVHGWVHDDTAAPGATYRYKVSYRMKNPVFTNKLAVKDVSLIDKFELISPDSGWSSAIDVASNVSFFVNAAPSETAGTVAMHVFRWKGGDPHGKVFRVSVGDIVGKLDGDVDFSTGWTVVDFSRDAGQSDWLVILMDSKGAIRRRSLREDAKDPRYQRLKDQVHAAVAPAAAAAN